MKIAVFFCTILLLSGCSAKDGQLPSTGILSEQQIQEAYHIDRAWWKLYNDPSLNALVEMALERNVDLARSTISVNRALYQARQLGAELIPSFSGKGESSSKNSLDSGKTARSFNASFGISYELDLWGRLRDASSAKTWEYRATEQDREATKLALINSVVNTWYSMAYTSQALTLSRDNLAYYEKLLRIIEEKYQSGQIDGLSPLQARQSLLTQKNTVLRLEEELNEEIQTLHNLLNLRPQEEIDYSMPDLLSLSVPSVDLNVPIESLGSRPDVNAAAYRLLSAFRDKNAAERDLFPSLSIGGSLGLSSSSSSEFFRSSFLNGLVSLSLPFLDWNRVKWNVKIAEANYKDSVLSFQKAVTTALNEVSMYYASLENSRQQLENIKKKYNTDAQIEAYRKARYEAGADELKDWLDALRTRNESRLSVLEKKYSVISASNAIWQAMGGRISAS